LPPSVYVRRRIIVFGVIPGGIALFIIGIVASLSGSPSITPPVSSTTTTAPATASHVDAIGVGVRAVSYLDSSRTTFNYTTGKTINGRRLRLEIRYPTHDVTTAGETANAPMIKGTAYPVIVFAPGYRHRAQDYAPLLDDWVSAGFVVASIAFPDDTYPASDKPYAANLPHGSPEGDVYNEPGDVAFVLGRLGVAAKDHSSFLDGAINPQETFLAGQSDGANVVAALIYDSADQTTGTTVRGVAVLSGAEFAISGQSYGQTTPPTPLLVVQSATDLCNSPASAVQLYDGVGAPKYFLELSSATHLGAYDGTNVPATAAVGATTVAFFRLELGAQGATAASLLAAGNRSGVSAITSGPDKTPIPAPSGTPSCPAD
jgi:hypothetical protein